MSTVGRQLGSRGVETLRGWFLRSGIVRFARERLGGLLSFYYREAARGGG